MFEIHPLSGKEKKMSAESSLSTHKVSRIYSESLTIKNVKSEIWYSIVLKRAMSLFLDNSSNIKDQYAYYPCLCNVILKLFCEGC